MPSFLRLPRLFGAKIQIMKTQPANISSLWFFTKIGIICVLGVLLFVQVHAMLRKPALVPSIPSVAATPLKTQASPQKSDQVKLPKQPAKPSLTKALMNPETYALIKDEFKRRLDAPYGKLYRQLNLEPATLQKLRGLLAEKELTMVEGFRLAQGSKTPFSAAALATIRNDADGPIKELLGDDAYSTYKNYENTLPARNQVDVLEKRLSYQTEPLTTDQYNALVAAFSGLPDKNIAPGSGAWMGDYTPDTTSDCMEIAKSILTPAQFAIYSGDYEDAKASAEAYQEYNKKLANESSTRRAQQLKSQKTKSK